MRTNFDKNIARLQFQSADMVKAHDEKLKAEKENAINESINTIVESSFLNIGSDIHTKRMRQQNAERAMNYKEHFVTLALTEALSKCAEDALLLNTEEYAKLNENYKKEINETIREFLENADINENIDNPTVLSLYEEILKELPPSDLYLTEDDEKIIVREKILTNNAINNGLEALCRDVRTRAANIVAKDQDAMVDQDNVLQSIDDKELEHAPIVSPENGEMMPMAPEQTDEMPLPDPDMDEEDMVDPVQNPEFTNSVEPIVTESLKPRIIKEKAKQGIVETLAMNEATKMLSEGKEYNSVLALANSLKLITVLETLDASGLVTIGTEGYNRILSASGVDMTPHSSVDIPGSNITDRPIGTVETRKDLEQYKEVELPENNKESTLRNKISNIVRSSMPDGLTLGKDLSSEVFTPYHDWKKEHTSASEIKVFDTPTAPVMTEEELAGKYTNMKGEVFTESELMEYFENQGFNLNLSDFDELWRSWNFKKH